MRSPALRIPLLFDSSICPTCSLALCIAVSLVFTFVSCVDVVLTCCLFNSCTKMNYYSSQSTRGVWYSFHLWCRTRSLEYLLGIRSLLNFSTFRLHCSLPLVPFSPSSRHPSLPNQATTTSLTSFQLLSYPSQSLLFGPAHQFHPGEP